MAASAGIHLNGRSTGGSDARSVIGSRLIALNYVDRYSATQVTDGAFQERGLTRAGRTHEIEHKLLPIKCVRLIPAISLFFVNTRISRSMTSRVYVMTWMALVIITMRGRTRLRWSS
jgi:hypothetical protein